MAKSRPLSKNTWYEWCDWLINHITKSVKKSVSYVKERNRNLFPKDYKTKKISGIFDDKYIKYKNESDEQLIFLKILQYLENIRPYLHYLIDDLRTSGKWKIHLTIKINFVSTTAPLEYCMMHSKSDNSEFMMGFEMKSFKNFLNHFCRGFK